MPKKSSCGKGLRKQPSGACKVPCKSPKKRSKDGTCKWSRSSAIKKAGKMLAKRSANKIKYSLRSKKRSR